MLFGEFEQVGAALERPVTPGGDDLDVGVQSIGRKLEANLVVALAGGAVGDRIGAGFPGDVNQVLGDQRAGDRGAEQVDTFVDRIGAEHREDEILDELLADVLDVDFLDAEHFGLLAGRLELFALAEVGGEGDDFRAEFGLQPLQDDRGVETARIGENDLFHVFMRCHGFRPSGLGRAAMPRANLRHFSQNLRRYKH